MDRRTFLKITGMGSIAFAAGCSSDPERKLYTLVRAPEDMVTGKAAWYATTCRECPSGCGVLAKNREGRVIKLEGNPLHPVNQGKLCARGQAALQGLYNPDRIKTPLLKTAAGWQSIDYPKAVDLIQTHMQKASAKGFQRIAMITEVVGDTLLNLLNKVLSHHGARDPLVYEPFGFEPLKFAHNLIFGRPMLPGFRMDQADLLVSFGADFLEGWLSPVEYARKFKSMHAVESGQKGLFVHFSPYMSLTAANADKWFACRPGSEAAILMMLIQNALNGGRGHHLRIPLRIALDRMTRPYTVAKVSKLTDLPVAELGRVTHNVMTARNPLILGSGTAAHGTGSTAVDLASTLLNFILDPGLTLYDFDQRHRAEIAAPRSAAAQIWKAASHGNLDLLFLNNVNPVYTMTGNGAADALGQKDLFVVAFANAMDETAAAADLIFPFQSALESWDVYESKLAMKATLQPATGKMGSAPNLGDLFLQLLPDDGRPASDYRSHLIRQLAEANVIDTAGDWIKTFQNGGRFVAGRNKTKPAVAMDDGIAATLSDLMAKVTPPQSGKQTVYVAPSLRHWDGRGANRSWLSEIPDPVTQVAWQTVAWVHPQVMSANGWSDGDMIQVQTDHGQVAVQAYAYSGLHPDAMVIPMGQGHTQYGRYARGQGVNPAALLADATDPLSGAPDYTASLKQLKGTGQRSPLAIVSGSRDPHDRKIALSVPVADAVKPDPSGKGLTMNEFPLTLPLPEGYDRHRDIYAPHEHNTYRWGMVVDLDRCIGCSACVAACYAENNIGIVGEGQILKGREMAWIRIERYENPDDPNRHIYLPMMCQHCDNAPCESVCPVYAPHHSKEGLNNQVYNRCIGTRFCAQNCPYKVRRFNWLDWQWPEPLDLQLNTNVTVRSKGVMEKCSFCVQRIKAAHNDAKNENRKIRDGEVTPACVQTCPTSALHFGNLMDTQSTVRKLTTDPRAYQVMGYLNVKPAVIYLKKVTQTI